MSALLEIEDLDVHFALPLGLSGLVSKSLRRKVRAVDGVSLVLSRGETLGLVGESGCGKTTLGRAALRLIPATGGAIRFDGEDVTALRGERLKAFHRRAQMVFQDPHTSLNPLYSVGRTLREVLEVHRLCPPAEMRGRIVELLIQVGLQPELVDRRPSAPQRRPVSARRYRACAGGGAGADRRRRVRLRARRLDPGPGAEPC